MSKSVGAHSGASPGVVDAEAVLARVLHRTPIRPLVRRVLASDAVWKLSGLSFATSIVATTGSYSGVDAYVRSMQERMARVQGHFPPNARVIDFGTGLGGNLFGAHDFISTGTGVDLNPFYIRRASLIARRLGMTNLRFVSYDGQSLPPLPRFNALVAFGTFERLSRSRVSSYIAQLSAQAEPGAVFLLYFLTEWARGIGFGRLLGQSAYTFWKESEIESVLTGAGLAPRAVLRRFPNVGDTYIAETTASAPPAAIPAGSRPAK